MSEEHTPGPWHVSKIDLGYGTVYKYEVWADYWPVKKANLIGVVSSRGYTTEDEANAALMAATPELLEACELSDWLPSRYEGSKPCPYRQRHDCPYPGENRGICSRCATEVRRAAIAKAKGEGK